MNTSDFSRFEYLVKTNLFLSPDKKQNLISKFPLLSLENQQEALRILENADQDQRNVLQYALKKNPNLLSEVKQSIAHNKQNTIHEKERLTREKEQVSLEELESQLDDIFNN